MGLTDVIHRKDKEEIENVKDFYQTNPALSEALIEGMKDLKLYSNYYSDVASVLDPCAGLGAIGGVLKRYFRNVKEYDLYSGYGEMKDFLEETGKYSLVVMNPPYSNKDAFIRKSMEVGHFSFILLPENVSNYTKMNEEFLTSSEYIGKIKCFPKHFMTNSIDTIKFGGMSAYSFFCFTNDWDWKRKYSVQKFEIIKDIRKYLTK